MARRSHTAELVLWAAGLVCLSIVGTTKWHSIKAQQAAALISPETRSEEAAPPSQGVIGRVAIPDLGITAPLVDDTEQYALASGIAYVRGTARPGGLGNFAVAGHRDTFFRSLGKIQPGMTIQVVTADGSYTYVVDGTRIVQPDDITVLRTGDVPQMTLITCYPFHYLGSAPKRFVVTAHLSSL